MFGLSKPRLPRLTVIGRAMLSGVVVVALLAEGTGIVAGLSSSPGVASSNSVYVPLTPVRVLDSRYGTGLSGAFSSHVARTFQVTGNGGVPSDATAVTGNLTVTQQTQLGFLFIGPVAMNNPTSSTLNFPLGDDRANAVTVALGDGGTLSVTYAAPTSGPTAHVIFDVTGYFVAEAAGAPGPAGPQGPQGATGATGANGTDGTNGNTVLYGTGAPGVGTGVAGDSYIATNLNTIYGPKTTTWPTGTSLVGPTGATGAKGDHGPAGPAGVSGYEIVHSEATTVYSGYDGAADAWCPSGKVVLGGGYQYSQWDRNAPPMTVWVGPTILQTQAVYRTLIYVPPNGTNTVVVSTAICATAQ